MTLDQARDHIGDRVTYTAHRGVQEHGQITRVGDCYVFVKYDGDLYAKATAQEMLTLEGSS